MGERVGLLLAHTVQSLWSVYDSTSSECSCARLMSSKSCVEGAVTDFRINEPDRKTSGI